MKSFDNLTQYYIPNSYWILYIDNYLVYRLENELTNECYAIKKTYAELLYKYPEFYFDESQPLFRTIIDFNNLSDIILKVINKMVSDKKFYFENKLKRLS